MSYCRRDRITSDVYVIRMSSPAGFFCVTCQFAASGGDNFKAMTEREMIGHLKTHRFAGHKVPENALRRLRQEARERFR